MAWTTPTQLYDALKHWQREYSEEHQRAVGHARRILENFGDTIGGLAPSIETQRAEDLVAAQIGPRAYQAELVNEAGSVVGYVGPKSGALHVPIKLTCAEASEDLEAGEFELARLFVNIHAEVLVWRLGSGKNDHSVRRTDEAVLEFIDAIVRSLMEPVLTWARLSELEEQQVHRWRRIPITDFQQLRGGPPPTEEES